MPETSSKVFRKNIHKILNIWEERTTQEIMSLKYEKSTTIRDSLPEYLENLALNLSKMMDRSEPRKKIDHKMDEESGKKHGNDRSKSINYTIDQLISEYHVLRQVIFDVMESEGKILSALEIEIILCSIEKAVKNAATEFILAINNMQEQVSANLAHDLRNPTSAAKMSAQLILKKPDDKDRCIEAAERISNNMDRINTMISELLDSSRMKAGESPSLEFKKCDLDLIAKEVADELNIVEKNRIIIYSKGKCIGIWNKNSLRRILENLCTNALKYGHDSTPVTITLAQDELTATMSVHNEGKSISEVDLPLLFKKYKRASSSEKKIGWGLGLNVVKTLVHAHKGTIRVSSGIHKGTTFIVKLPKDQDVS